jgi:hypothetical protein
MVLVQFLANRYGNKSNSFIGTKENGITYYIAILDNFDNITPMGPVEE